MLRLIAGFVLVLAAALAAAWLADQPGVLTLRVGGYEVTASLLVAGAALAVFAIVLMLLWRSYYWITGAPEAIGDWFRNRGRRRGYDALSHGLIAAGAGDAEAAAREMATAERHLGGAPLTLLLKAQTAQLRGESPAARGAYEAMLALPDTEALGLRGLFLEARRAGNIAEARRLVERAVALKPGMDWASAALFELQAAAHDWTGARETLDLRRRHRQIDRKADARARAVLFAAEAQEADDAGRTDAALEAAVAAHRLAPELVAAAAIAGRILAERGETARATRLVEKTWKLSPHPDLATVYTHARPGDATHDRLRRARILVGKVPANIEGRVAAARAAVEGRDWEEARDILQPLLDRTPPRRVCMLMAEIENGEHGDRGRVREWLVRAVSAPRDPAWTAAGHVAERWLPVSPQTGAFDVYEWRVPVEGATAPVGDAIENLAHADDTARLPAIVTVDAEPASGADAEAEAADAGAESPEPESAPKPVEAPARKPTKPEAGPAAKADTPAKKPDDAPGALALAPIPDDPGIDGDDFDNTAARPKDLDGN